MFEKNTWSWFFGQFDSANKNEGDGNSNDNNDGNGVYDNDDDDDGNDDSDDDEDDDDGVTSAFCVPTILGTPHTQTKSGQKRQVRSGRFMSFHVVLSHVMLCLVVSCCAVS